MPRIYTADTFPVTLDHDGLARRPAVTLPPTYYLGSPGSACSGDPPGFPSYYVRPVYTSHGNSPSPESKCPDYVLIDRDGVLRAVPGYTNDGEALAALYRSVYRPLPVDHPRVQAWIRNNMRHFARCYVDEERPEYGRPGTLIAPLPSYRLKTFTDDPRWNDAYRAAARAEVEAFNEQETGRALRIATVPNHRGVRRIREHYPEWSPPSREWLNGEGFDIRVSGWWTTEAEPPAPGSCPGDLTVSRPHRDDFCQWCGNYDLL